MPLNCDSDRHTVPLHRNIRPVISTRVELTATGYKYVYAASSGSDEAEPIGAIILSDPELMSSTLDSLSAGWVGEVRKGRI